MIFIEFVGLPASGKSTIANRLISTLRNKGFKVTSPTYELKHEMSKASRIYRKMRYGIFAYFHSPILTTQQLKLIHGSMQQSKTDTVKNMYNWLYVAGLNQHSQVQTDVTVVDQGLIQALWSIDLSSKNQSIARLKQLVASSLQFIENKIIVIVKCGRSTIDQRLADRKRNASRVSSRTNSTYSVDEALESIERTIDVLSEFSSEFQNVIEVENNEQKDIGDAVSVIMRQIEDELSE